jgi:predicted DNA repair protein MutK
MALGLLTLLDDIGLMADDVATMSKVAAKKVTGVLSDDVALNAHQVSGFSPSRELPVVWAVAKGSAINKAIIVPIALLLVAFAPWALTPLLMLGGAFLCFEGVEKVFHRFLHGAAEDEAHHQQLLALAQMTPEQVFQHEKEKAKAAIRTDAILSAEIVVVALGTMQDAPLGQQALALVVLSVVFTVGVYGLVAAIGKVDDLGFYLQKSARRGMRAAGDGLVACVPYLMKTLSFLGTAALFLVGGGIIAHGTPPIHHLIESVDGQGGALSFIAPALGNLLTGVIAGTIVLGLVMLYKKLFTRPDTAR